MSEEILISTLVDSLKPFLRHLFYTLIKASLDTQLSLDEAARQMGINRNTLKKRCQRGTFPYSKVGGVYYISKMDVNIYIKGGIDELQRYTKDAKKEIK